MSQANEEQLKAINQKGNILLSAGAGSGKTFVIKEHLIFMVNEKIQEHPDKDDFQIAIRSFFRKTVVMTFTKKAAGELKQRIFNEFSQLAQNDTFWKLACEEFSFLNITTIHGFCLKLITMGVFNNLNAEPAILNEYEFKECINQALNTYYTKHLKPDNKLYELLLKEQKNIEKAFQGIFSDPSVRMKWRLKDKSSSENDNEMISKIISLQNWSPLFNFNISSQDLIEFSDKKWAISLSDFIENQNLFTKDLAGISNAYKYFENIQFKISSKPTSKKIDPGLIEYYEYFRDFKNFLKESGMHFVQQLENKKLVAEWDSEFSKIFKYISEIYESKAGYTFSDLEYLVASELERSEICRKVQDLFDYYIIDEFQDTSLIQSQIINGLIQNNMQKLFCVGDLKQAIYGFRGGEISVFKELSQKVKFNFSLKNNYRSHKAIIEFNNNFFKNLIQNEKSAVTFEDQTVPIEQNEIGLIYKLAPTTETSEDLIKLSNKEIEQIEAEAILIEIKKIINKEEQVAILYKRLKPSNYLLQLLMKHKIGFTAQVKIPFADDPIISIFYHLIEFEINQDKSKLPLLRLIINQFLALLGGEQIFSENKLEVFREECKYYGLYWSFSRFLSSLGLSNSQVETNLVFIKSLILSEDTEEVFKLFKANINNNAGVSLKYGENASNINIMTSHSSKGLEFENVLLGGVYTNGSSIPNTNVMGKNPKSFKWSLDQNKKNKFKTIAFILEELENKLAETQEDKRLFYVSATRAVKSLGWVYLDPLKFKMAKKQKEAWGQLLNMVGTDTICVESEIKSLDFSNKPLPSYYFLSNMGLTVQRAKSFGSLLPELSVTKLSLLASCPRKFYFQNFCKIEASDLEYFSLEYKRKNSVPVEAISSAKRGSELHLLISNYIQQKDKYYTQLLTKNSWIVENLESLVENYDLISEKETKFELFNYMISGIPDLVALPVNTGFGPQIWDFKTGMNSLQQSQYFLQLSVYAYGLYAKNIIDSKDQARLVLAYLDQEKIVEKKFSKEDVEKYILKYFKLINSPYFFNKDHCEFCDFQNICNR